jgi:2-amino-4-hydroxy-6-hydroxymethyldihydropteridine diphosphokinase
MAETVYLLLGSNMGDREKFLRTARGQLDELEGLEVVATSPIYISEAQAVPEPQPGFLNQVIKGEYQFTPFELLAEIEKIEAQLGRTDKGARLPRTIDIDILLFGDQIIRTEKLVIPHAALLERPFAMVPLVEVDPEVVHPAQKRPVADFLAESDREKIIMYEDHVARSV